MQSIVYILLSIVVFIFSKSKLVAAAADGMHLLTQIMKSSSLLIIL